MSTVLSPLVSEFETTEKEASYDCWFRAEVAASLADGQPTIPHDRVMAEMGAIIDEIEQRKANREKRRA